MRTQQYRTHNKYNMQLLGDVTDEGMPIVEASKRVPRRLIRYRPDEKDKDGYCHFYQDDYRFERIWTNPERSIGPLKEYKGAIGPDFSTYTDYPLPLQRWNVYRSKLLMQYWQSEGMEVIPNLQWSTEESYDFAFDGLPKGGTVAVSTVGVHNDNKAVQLFIRGVQEAWVRLQFETLLMYGGVIDCGLGSNVRIKTYDNDSAKRGREHGRKRRQ